MATTITRTQIRQEMLRRAPILGRALTADSLTKAGPTLTHVAEYERQRAGLTSYEGQYIHRYNLADPQRWRRITTIDGSTGIISVDGPAWTDNTDLAYERLTVHPDDLNFAIAEAQRRQRIRTNIALVRGGLDLDMEATGTNAWGTAVATGGSSKGNVTLTKDTTQAFSGTQSMKFVAGAATPYTIGSTMRVTPGRQAYFAAIVLPSVGPITFQIFDFINNTVLQSVTLTSGLGGWTLMYIQMQIPINTDTVQYMFTSSSASAIFWVDTCFGPYQAGQTEYPVQSAINEAYKLRFVRPSAYVSPTQTTGCLDADSLTFIGDLLRPDDWDLEVFRRDLNSNRLRFQANSYNNRNVGWGFPSNVPGGTFMQNSMRPIWLAMEAQASDFEPVLTETSTTGQPLDECACYALRYVAETLTQRDPSNVVWANLLAEYKAWSVIEDQGRPPQAMYTPQRYHHVLA